MTYKRTLLTVGAHPDDIEIGMGGTVAQHSKTDNVYMLSLTEGGLSSNGTVETRQQEAERAAEILGASRLQFTWRDRMLTAVTPEEYTQLVQLIRRIQPDTIFAPYYIDRHPDHGDAGNIVKRAVFDAGVKLYPGVDENAHKVPNMYYYMINGYHRPAFYVDITAAAGDKEAALKAYKSQFDPGEEAVSTPLTDGYLETIQARDRLFGKETGVTYAEGFIAETPMLFQQVPGRQGSD